MPCLFAAGSTRPADAAGAEGGRPAAASGGAEEREEWEDIPSDDEELAARLLPRRPRPLQQLLGLADPWALSRSGSL